MKRLIGAARALADAVRPRLASPPRPGMTVLSPLDYGRANHEAYVARHARRGVEAVLFGMNPGPWGMAQTGVPFGDPSLVASFLGIDGRVDRPANEHPRCPILGPKSPRGEVSGRRLWGGIELCFGDPARFFARFYVANYCPLLFLDAKGANVTPDKLPGRWMAPVLDACDAHARAVVDALGARVAIGIGAWTERRLAAALAGKGVRVARVLHPSPASPLANQGWLDAARRDLAAAGCPWPPPRANGGRRR